MRDGRNESVFIINVRYLRRKQHRVREKRAPASDVANSNEEEGSERVHPLTGPWAQRRSSLETSELYIADHDESAFDVGI